MVERQSIDRVWANGVSSRLYTTSDASSLFSYWYQTFENPVQILATFFQELGANSLTVARYIERNRTDGGPWQRFRHSISIQDGSPIAAAPVGSRRELRLYVGGTDGKMRQYPYNIETNELEDSVGEL